MNLKIFLVLIVIILILGGSILLLTYKKETCRMEVRWYQNGSPTYGEVCLAYNPIDLAFRQYLNSADLRCGAKKSCREYTVKANMGIVVDECKNLTKEDICYYTYRNMSPTQIEIQARNLKNITFTCNYNTELDWCDYNLEQCEAWRIGLYNWNICPIGMDLKKCGEYFNVSICKE
jgi:hypothetical protein